MVAYRRMTFDLTPEQQALVSKASTTTTLPAAAMDAVLIVEEQSRCGRSIPDLARDGDGRRARLMSAAAAVGIGRAAIAHAVQFMKANNVMPGPDATVPHWTVADGATEIEAARLLTYEAAQSLDRGDQADGPIARAVDLACQAAQRAVDAAIKVEGAGHGKGSLLDRLASDVRALPLILK